MNRRQRWTSTLRHSLLAKSPITHQQSLQAERSCLQSPLRHQEKRPAQRRCVHQMNYSRYELSTSPLFQPPSSQNDLLPALVASYFMYSRPSSNIPHVKPPLNPPAEKGILRSFVRISMQLTPCKSWHPSCLPS